MKFLLVASGGDAPAINNYLKFLIDKFPKEDFFYSEYGFNGAYKNSFKNINKKNDLRFLYDMPSSFIKCGRFKPFKNDFEARNIVIKNIVKFDYLILLGGNGTEKAAKIIAKSGVKTIFVPLTIDNDIKNTDLTLGYLTSLKETIKNINNITYTMEAHGYVGLVEIMGRDCSDLTKESLLLSRANLALYKENIISPKEFAQTVKKDYKKLGHCTCLIMEKMKYSISDYCDAINASGLIARPTSLGHTQRGGITSFADIKVASMFAEATEEAIKLKKSGQVAFLLGKKKFHEW